MTSAADIGRSLDDPSGNRHAQPFITISEPMTWRRYLTSTWAARDFIWTLANSRLKSSNQGTALGMVWHLLTPLLTAAVFLVVFGYILQISRNRENYTAFLVIGIFIFQFTSRAMMGGASSLWREGRLISSLHFPRLVIPLASITQEAIAFVPAIVTLMFLVLVTGGTPHLTWFLVIPALGIQTVFVLGVSMGISRLAYRYRDVEQIMPFLLRMWLYLSGVFYGLDLIEDRAGPLLTALFAANPMFQFIDLNRKLLMDAELGGANWLAVTAWSVVAFIWGLTYFRAGEQSYGHG